MYSPSRTHKNFPRRKSGIHFFHINLKCLKILIQALQNPSQRRIQDLSAKNSILLGFECASGNINFFNEHYNRQAIENTSKIKCYYMFDYFCTCESVEWEGWLTEGSAVFVGRDLKIYLKFNFGNILYDLRGKPNPCIFDYLTVLLCLLWALTVILKACKTPEFWFFVQLQLFWNRSEVIHIFNDFS